MPSHDPTYPLFPVMSFLGFVLAFIPLPWHIQAWNSGTCAYMLWSGLACLNLFVNSLVWKGNVRNVAPIWCDICTLTNFLPMSPLVMITDISGSFEAIHWCQHWNTRRGSVYQPTTLHPSVPSVQLCDP
jgi:hypothetical protein